MGLLIASHSFLTGKINHGSQMIFFWPLTDLFSLYGQRLIGCIGGNNSAVSVLSESDKTKISPLLFLSLILLLILYFQVWSRLISNPLCCIYSFWSHFSYLMT